MQMCVVASLESRSARRSLWRWRNPPKRCTYWPDGDKMQARCLAGDVASTGGAEDAEGYYRDALVLAESVILDAAWAVLVDRALIRAERSRPNAPLPLPRT